MQYKFEHQFAKESPRFGVRWGKLLAKTAVWASAEIVLNVVGLDTVADYTEFLNQHQVITQAAEAFSNLITLV